MAILNAMQSYLMLVNFLKLLKTLSDITLEDGSMTVTTESTGRANFNYTKDGERSLTYR